MPFCPFWVIFLIIPSAISPMLPLRHLFSIPTIQNPSLSIILSPLSPRMPPAPACHLKRHSSSPSEISTLHSSSNHHIHPHCTRLFLFNSPYSCRFRPQLRSPLPLTPTGRPVQPLPHKSFLQKYWIYIALFLLALGLSFNHVHSITDLHDPSVLTSSEDTGPRRHAQA